MPPTVEQQRETFKSLIKTKLPFFSWKLFGLGLTNISVIKWWKFSTKYKKSATFLLAVRPVVQASVSCLLTTFDNSPSHLLLWNPSCQFLLKTFTTTTTAQIAFVQRRGRSSPAKTRVCLPFNVRMNATKWKCRSQVYFLYLFPNFSPVISLLSIAPPPSLGTELGN